MKKFFAFVGKLLVMFGGKKAIKRVLVDFITKLLVRKAGDPKKLAQDIHDEIQDNATKLLGGQPYEKIEKLVLEPFAAELVRLWKKD